MLYYKWIFYIMYIKKLRKFSEINFNERLFHLRGLITNKFQSLSCIAIENRISALIFLLDERILLNLVGTLHYVRQFGMVH